MGALNIPMQAIPGAGLSAFFESLALYVQYVERRQQPAIHVPLRTAMPVLLSPENPGQLAAHARFYLARALAHPDSPHAERWTWLANWYRQRSLGKVVPARRSVQVKRADLAAGDVISAGFFLSQDQDLTEIVEIEQNGSATMRNLATGQLTSKVFRADCGGSWGYSVVMGPKVEAIARKLPGINLGRHPQYDAVLRWQRPATANPPQPTIREVLITDWDITPGDVIQRRGTNARPMLVLSVEWPRATVRFQDGQKEQTIERIENVNQRWMLIGGPKLEAIRRDLSLIQFNAGPNNWLWVGAKALTGD